MGKINCFWLFLSLSFGCMPDYEDSYLCQPEHIGNADFVFIQTGPDTISLDSSVFFKVSGLNPKINKQVTTERLPYPPITNLIIEAVSDTQPPWADMFNPDYYYPAVRPFRVFSKPGSSSYIANNKLEIHGELKGDSIYFEFQLKALTTGLYKISWDSRLPLNYYYHLNTVILDAKKQQCNYFWRMMPYFEANQQLDSIKAAFPNIYLTDRPIYRFIYVRD